jgi:hypothetical protein
MKPLQQVWEQRFKDDCLPTNTGQRTLGEAYSFPFCSFPCRSFRPAIIWPLCGQ